MLAFEVFKINLIDFAEMIPFTQNKIYFLKL